jgi:hypothetical protein
MIFASGFTESTEDGKVTARFAGEHLVVGYYKSHQVAKWPQLKIGGHRLAICPETLGRLQGKRLTLREPFGRSDIWPDVLVAAGPHRAP